MTKMTEEDWGRIRYFSINEDWGEPMKMDRDLIYLLDGLRGLFHHPFVIHCGYKGGGHSRNSQHYVGKAADFHIEGMALKDAVDLMLDFISPPPRGLGIAHIVGLGIYPHWRNPGFHLDTRGSKARWGAIVRGGRQVYVGFEEAYRNIQ